MRRERRLEEKKTDELGYCEVCGRRRVVIESWRESGRERERRTHVCEAVMTREAMKRR
jgi:hypothetical protein